MLNWILQDGLLAKDVSRSFHIDSCTVLHAYSVTQGSMRPYCNRDLLLKQNCRNRYLELCLSATAHFSSFYRLNRHGSFVKCVNCYSLHTDGPGAGLERHCKYHWTVYHCIVESIQLCGNWFNRLSLLSVQMPYSFYSLPIFLLLDPLMSSRKEIIFLKIDFLSHWLPHRYSDRRITAAVSARLRLNLCAGDPF